MYRTLNVLFCILLAANCYDTKNPPNRPEPAPFTANDAGGPVCERACKHLSDLGCKEGSPTKKGASCAEVCTNAEEHGFTVNPTCLEHVATCAAVNSCAR